ncbi:hypothetical protein H4R18_003665 [Coemansia javaensis]|uniref:RRM domain-containing protein n=1 Tax=Coemansia javaensis TaxID=2761396 RepID=A0A9W8H805_9FUNG|nr:hypothetical protein H4R18_003665 [Coemansia javaensis]
MATNLDRSLDEIISETPRSGRRRGGARNQNRSSPYSRADAAPQKRDRKQPQPQQQMMMVNQSALLAAMAQQQQHQGDHSGVGKILISNLDFGVTEADLRMLFGQVGPVIRATLHYGPSGKSRGTGEVVFRNPIHATAAVDRYNNVELDNRKMRIEAVGAAPAAMPMFMPAMLQQAMTQQKPQQKQRSASAGGARAQNAGSAPAAAQNGAGKRGRRGRRNSGDKRSPMTKEELDADLDSYMDGVEKSGQ